MDNLDVWPFSVENEALLTCIFYLIAVSNFLKTCVKVMEIATADCYKEGFD